MKSKTLRFEYGKSKDGQFYWHIKAANGEIIAQGEGYKRRTGVLKVFHLMFDFDTSPELIDLDSKMNKCIETLATSKVACRCKKPGRLNRNWP